MTFDTLGFLSPDSDTHRSELREQFQLQLTRVEALSEAALSDFQEETVAAPEAYLVALGFWLRSIESCQAAVLLIERGLPSAPYSNLRTAYECLFYACALWRKPSLTEKLQASHDTERLKQAKAMLTAGAERRVTKEGFAHLKSIANEPGAPGGALTAWEAACAADLVFEYQTAYRGFGIAGAHASLRSLDDFIEERPDGTVDINFRPNAERTDWLLGLVAMCLKCGTDRRRDAHRSLIEEIGQDRATPESPC